MSHPCRMDFNVGWNQCCYMCDAPMGLYFVPKVPSKRFYGRLVNFMKLSPLKNMQYNSPMYKFFGLRVRRVCAGCYYHRPRVNIAKRETGQCRPRQRNLSISKTELYRWCESLNRYLNRPDADEYVVRN